MKTFVVGHIDWFDHNLTLEKITAVDWLGAVQAHSKFPFEAPKDYSEASHAPETFKQLCFDCDCMMNWIEI